MTWRLEFKDFKGYLAMGSARRLCQDRKEKRKKGKDRDKEWLNTAVLFIKIILIEFNIWVEFEINFEKLKKQLVDRLGIESDFEAAQN
jgi:hypothetical protein